MRRSVGLEIANAAVRWVELEEERGRQTVRSSGVVPLSGTGDIAVTEAIRQLSTRHRWSRPSDRFRTSGSGQEIILSLPRAEATLRWLTLPQAAREDTAGMVELEAGHSFPFPVDEAAWDFLSFPGADAQQDVLLVAARRSFVQQQRRAVEAGGPRVAAISVDVLATIALYLKAIPDPRASGVLLHLEGNSAIVTWLVGRRLLLTRSITSASGWTPQSLGAEVRRTLVAGAMAGGASGQPSAVGAIWLTGEGAAEELARELTLVLQPAAGTEGEQAQSIRAALLPRASLPGGEELAPELDVAFGLALIGQQPPLERLDVGRSVRMIAETNRPGPARRLPLLAGGTVAAAAILLMVLAAPGSGERELAAVASRATADAHGVATRRTQMEGRVRRLVGAVFPEHSYLDALNDVSALAGQEAWLTQFTYDRGRPSVIRGSARSNLAVARLVDGLRRSPHLERVTLGSVTRSESEEIPTVQFTITGSLRGDALLEPPRRRTARTARGSS